MLCKLGRLKCFREAHFSSNFSGLILPLRLPTVPWMWLLASWSNGKNIRVFCLFVCFETFASVAVVSHFDKAISCRLTLVLWVFWGSGSLDTTCPVTLCFCTGYKVIWAVVSTRVTLLCTEVQNFFFTQYEYTRVKFGWCFFSYHLIMPRCLMHHYPSVIKKERKK